MRNPFRGVRPGGVSCPAARAEAGRMLFGHPAGGDPGECACPEAATHGQELSAELRRAFEAPTKLAAAVLATIAMLEIFMASRRRAGRGSDG